jgi:hypothetical protein
METIVRISLWYLLIGTLLTAFYDWLQQKVVQKEELIFTNWERILLIFGWPIIILISVIKNMKQKE